VASPATSIVLSSARRHRVIDWPYRDTRLFCESLRHEISRRTSIKQDVSFSSSCSTSKHHTRKPVLHIGSTFDAEAARNLHVSSPASANTLSAAQRDDTRPADVQDFVQLTRPEPSSCNWRTRPPLGTVKTQRKSFNKVMFYRH
jgi:hypothetical protein